MNASNIAWWEGIATSALIRRIVLSVLFVALVVGVGSFYLVSRQRALDLASKEARLLLATATAVSDFADQELFPLLGKLPHDTFYKQVVPFNAAHAVYHRLQEKYPNYTFRQTALNPTNPADRPRPHEVELTDRFRDDPALQRLEGTRQDGARTLFYVAQPLQVANEQCLVCHSTPARAPPAMVAAYGSSGGFSWKLGETVGIIELSVPVTEELRSTTELAALFAAGLLVAFLILYVALTVTLSAALVRPLQRLARTAETASLGAQEAGAWPSTGTLELRQLGEAFARLDVSLRKAMRALANRASSRARSE